MSLLSAVFGRKNASKDAAPVAVDLPEGAEEIEVSIVPTPNPDARMLKVAETLVPSGTFEYADLDKAEGSPLAQRLLGVQGVELVLIAKRFVTVRKKPELQWDDLLPALVAQVQESLFYGEMAVLEAERTATPHQRTAIEQKILQLLDEEIRPAIAQDGGDCTFEGFEDGIVKLRLIGACGTCPSSVTTLKMGIERLMVEEIPEVTGVESV